MPPNEDARLAALLDLEILDTPAEQLFDDVVELAAAFCDTPIAMVNFVAADRQWAKALVGSEVREAPRAASFCAHAIAAESGLLVVGDTLAEHTTAQTGVVPHDPTLRFYAGVAIVDAEGHALGSVCVADRSPRSVTAEQLDALRRLARQAGAHLRLRRQTRQLAAADDELRRTAIEDPLTGLVSRALLFDRLTQALGRRRRLDGQLGVLYCDLDSFKPINARLGFNAGDEVLRLVAERLSSAARVTDTVARLTGDEFVVVCPDVGGRDELERLAARITHALTRPARIGGLDMAPRVSIGMALAEAGDDAESLLVRADDDMYITKWRGRLGPEPDAVER